MKSGKAIIGEGIYKEKKMPEWNEFNIVPGDSAWVDMPRSYKNAYKRYHEKVLKKKEKKRKEAEKIKKLQETKSEKIIRNLTPDQVQSAKELLEGQGIKVDAYLSNMIDDKFFENLNKGIKKDKNKPSVLLVCDVKGWAWWNKSQYLKYYLSDEFNIDIINVIGPGAKSVPKDGYDLWLTYGYSYILNLRRVPKNKRMTGVTAHRPRNVLESKMKKAFAVHANSKMLLEELKKMHNRCYYVPNGVDENLFKPIKFIDTSSPLMVGHVGKKCTQKGQDGIIMPAIKAAGVNSITETSDYRNKKPYSHMFRIYQDMDVFVVASVEDGTPNPALEAAACGRPIISNKIGNMPEFIKDGWNGLIVDLEVDAYRDALKWCANNKNKLKEMGMNARRTVEEGWTWKIQAENYRKMFWDAIKNKEKQKWKN